MKILKRSVLSFFILVIIFSFSSFAQNGTKKQSLFSLKPKLDITTSTTPPVVATSSASIVTAQSAKLNGTVNPEGFPTSVFFDWGTSITYSDSTAKTNAGAGTSTNPYSSTLTGLTPNTQYHFRAMATSAAGSSIGLDKFFITLPDTPIVNAIFFTDDIDMTDATLHAYINPQGALTEGWFVWGVGDSLKNVTDTIVVGSSTGLQEIKFPLSNLQPNTTYGFKTYAQNSGGRSSGPTQGFFTTLASPEEYTPDGYTVGLYHLNDAGLFIEDYSGNGNDGELSSSQDNPSFSTPTLIPGQYGNARNFNTENQFIQVPSNNFTFGAKSFTLEAWVKPELGGGGSMVIMDYGSTEDSSASFNFMITPSMNLSLSLSGDGSTEYIVTSVGSAIVNGSWQHVAAVVDMANDSVKLYRNGGFLTTTEIGTFPAILNTSVAPLRFGASSSVTGPRTRTILGATSCALDEIRISEVARDPSEFTIPSSISGFKFWDRNNDHYNDAGDTVLGNWKIVLKQIIPGITPIVLKAETTMTDQNGYYAFTNLLDGSYQVNEIQQDGWLQTYPRGNGSQSVVIDSGRSATNVDFGNTYGYTFVGPSGGSWSNPANWLGGTVPSDTTPVYLNGNVTYDVTSSDTIFALRLGPGGSLTFSPGSGPLNVSGKVEIGNGAAFQYPDGDFSAVLYCNGDFVNQGTFYPGNSTVYFNGNDYQIIFDSTASTTGSARVKGQKHTSAFNGNHFYNLSIVGSNTSTVGNVVVDNQIALFQSLSLRSQDTLFVENSASSSIAEDGSLPGGTVRRKIAPNSTDSYRFESPDSYVQFDGTSGSPTYLSMTTLPGTSPETSGIHWKLIPSTVDTANNTVTASGINHFSKWVFGKPGSGFDKRKIISTGPQFVTPVVGRTYVIKPTGSTQFNATLQLRFDDSEFTGDKSGLQLGQGAYFTDTLYQRWNMVSLPVIPDYVQKDSVFPTSVSQAFAFSGGYVPSTSLSFGAGYWLKFSADQVFNLLGNDESTGSFRVVQGWNMIGALSYPVDVTTVTLSPDAGGTEDLSSATFFGYRNGYQVADILNPLRSYWVKVDNTGYLNLSQSSGSPKHTTVASALNKLNSLSVQDAGGNEQTLYFGYSKVSVNKNFELPPTPPQGILDVRFATGTMVEMLSNKTSKVIPITVSSAATPYTISWNVKDKSGSGTLLVDGQEYPMVGSGKVTVTNAKAELGLRLSSQPASGLPTQFALYQNYPNPFNPTTTVAFDLPKDELVTLKVYNILGQEVATIINNVLYNAGSHVTMINSANWSSGIYFYKLSAGQFSGVKKMILAR